MTFKEVRVRELQDEPRSCWRATDWWKWSVGTETPSIVSDRIPDRRLTPADSPPPPQDMQL